MTIDEKKAKENIDIAFKQSKLQEVTEKLVQTNQRCPQCGSMMEIDGGDVLICMNCGYKDVE